MEGTRKIITKAIYGHKTERFEKKIEIGANDGAGPEKVLGGTVTGMDIKECVLKQKTASGCQVEISGEYGVHIWYQTDETTKIFKEMISFKNVLDVLTPPEEETVGHQEMRTWVEKQPECSQKLIKQAKTDENIIEVTITYDLGVEIIGESSMYVKIVMPENDI